MSITSRQASDLIQENCPGALDNQDSTWALLDEVTSYPSVKALRRADPFWRVPRWWPGATVGATG